MSDLYEMKIGDLEDELEQSRKELSEALKLIKELKTQLEIVNE